MNILTESDPEFIGPRTSGQYQEETACADCGDTFQAWVYMLHLREMFRQRYCPQCVALKEANFPDALHESRQTKWERICPASYCKTDLARLRSDKRLRPTNARGDSGFVDSFIARGSHGVGLIGPSRIGKTRLMFALLSNLFMSGGRVSYIFAPDFSDIYAALMGESPAKGNSFLESCVNADLWFLDDLGKGRLSEPAQRALMRVVEKRTNSERPIFITSNHDGNVLIDKMRYDDGRESEYAVPMLERLKEFCQFFIF